MIIRSLLSAAFAVAVLGQPSSLMAQQTPAKPATSADPSAAAPAQPRRIPDTLMFTIDELTDIQSRLGAAQDEANNRTRSGAIENASLYLSTILYSGPNEWTIWVNGRPISPGQDFQDFQITDIGPRFVELLVPLSAQGMRPVRLEPNQTFITRSGAVVEGAWRP